MVCGQWVRLGRSYAGCTVAVHVAETTLSIELGDGAHGEPDYYRAGA
jgi:hypothetical protein